MIDSFDIILLNPPWYFDYYEIFIHRALELLKNTGQIYLTLFQPLSRNKALQDLIKLESFIASTNPESITHLMNTEFEMPNFEKRVIESYSVPLPDQNWRSGELINIRYKGNKQNTTIVDFFDNTNWKRYYNDDSNIYTMINQDIINHLLSDT